MKIFPRRSKRINTDFEVKVRLKEKSSEKILVEETTAVAINFSKGGACLIFPTIFVNRIHLFFATLRGNSHTLLLHWPPELNNSEQEMVIDAQSVWMDSCDIDDFTAFKVGVQFAEKQSALYNLVRKRA